MANSPHRPNLADKRSTWQITEGATNATTHFGRDTCRSGSHGLRAVQRRDDQPIQSRRHRNAERHQRRLLTGRTRPKQLWHPGRTEIVRSDAAPRSETLSGEAIDLTGMINKG